MNTIRHALASALFHLADIVWPPGKRVSSWRRSAFYRINHLGGKVVFK